MIAVKRWSGERDGDVVECTDARLPAAVHLCRSLRVRSRAGRHGHALLVVRRTVLGRWFGHGRVGSHRLAFRRVLGSSQRDGCGRSRRPSGVGSHLLREEDILVAGTIRRRDDAAGGDS